MQKNHGRSLISELPLFFSKTIRFYDVKVTRVVFTVMILVSLLSIFIPISPNDSWDIYTIMLSFISAFAIYLFSAIYLYAYLNEIRSIKYTNKDILMFVKKKGFKVIGSTLFVIVIVSFILTLALFISVSSVGVVISFVLIIWALSIYISLLFSICFIADKNYKIIESFKASRKLTKGRKNEILILVMLISMLFLPIMIFFMMLFAGVNEFAATFSILFLSMIYNLMLQRITVQIYLKLLDYSANSGDDTVVK